MNAHDLWSAAQGELQQQMTRATFDQWVRQVHAQSLGGDCLVLEVPSIYAKEWLEKRLQTTVSRVVTGIYGSTVTIQYVLPGAIPKETETDDHDRSTDTVVVDLIESPLVPFIQVQKYALWYWQPVLGCTAFATWNMLRTLDKQNDGQGNRHRVSVEVIADTLGVNRQAITGRPRGSSWTKGAFGVLNAEGLAKIESIRDPLDHRGRSTIYWARVLNSVPYLAPAQVAKLPQLIQERHDQFLKDFAVDAEKWEQITLDSLVPGHKQFDEAEMPYASKTSVA